MSGRRIRRLVIALFVLAGCARTPPPNVLLVTFDTVRYDHFGFTGDAGARTPIIDALASRGIAFDHAYSSVPVTLPAHTTMMTGMEPFTHGVRNNGNFRVPQSVTTLAERLKAVGYQTGAFVSAEVLDARYGLDRGFDVYDNRTNAEGGTLFAGVTKRRGDQTTDAAIAWLDKTRTNEHPFFLWVHYFDAHQPYQLPPPFDRMPDPYSAGISFSDEQVGRLLDRVTRVEGARGTLVIFTADHGESLGEHGETTHGIVAYDATLHVPLVVAGRGVAKGLRRAALAGDIDIVPTVLEAARLSVPRELGGRDLVHGTDTAADTTARYFECEGARDLLGWQSIAGVRTARWKYTAIPSPPELYDVSADPRELHNVVDSEPAVRESLEAGWASFRSARDKPPDAALKNVSSDTRERLAALGYISAPQKFAEGDVPDPRRFVGTWHWVAMARSLAVTGHYDEAIVQLESMAESPSVRALVLRTLAPVYAAAGRFDEAIRVHRAYLEINDDEAGRLDLAGTLIRADRPAEALHLLDERDCSDCVTSAIIRSVALVHLGRQEEARAVIDKSFTGRERLERLASVVLEGAPVADGAEELRKLLSESPQDGKLMSDLGYYLAVWGRPNEAEEAFGLLSSAATARPDDPEVHSNLGWGAYRLGRDEDAVAGLTAALRIEKTRQRDRFRLVFPLIRKGKIPAAVALLKSAARAEPGTSWAKRAPELLALLDENPSVPVVTLPSMLHRFDGAGD